MEIAELFKAMQEGFTKLENGQLDINTELKEVKQRLGSVEIKLEVVENKIGNGNHLCNLQIANNNFQLLLCPSRL